MNYIYILSCTCCIYKMRLFSIYMEIDRVGFKIVVHLDVF